MKRIVHFLIVSILIFLNINVFAVSSEEQLDPDQYSARLNKLDFLPELLPIIIQNSDAIGLNEVQVNKLLEWRRINRDDMVATMKEIARKRSEIRRSALKPTVSSARIEQMQTEIFRLERRMLDYKLSCRDTVMHTFNRKNWEDFLFVLADKGIGVELPTMMATK